MADHPKLQSGASETIPGTLTGNQLFIVVGVLVGVLLGALIAGLGFAVLAATVATFGAALWMSYGSHAESQTTSGAGETESVSAALGSRRHS